MSMTSPFKAIPKAGLWHVVFYFRKQPDSDFTEKLDAAIEGLALSLFIQEQPSGERWKIEMVTAGKPDEHEFKARLALVESLSNTAFEDFTIEPLPDRDWLTHVYESFPPVQAGRFFVYGSHYKETPPAGSIPLMIDAATAFGSGEHETTKTCLLALEDLHTRFPDLERGLDMGCGSGILAIAMAKLWPAMKILAVDIDPESVHVTERHMSFNNVQAHIKTEAGDGYAAPSVAPSGPFDLIVANILAGPLIEFSGSLSKNLRPGGRAVLSGLLARQAPDVIKAHKDKGLAVEKEFPLGVWQTLVLRRR